MKVEAVENFCAQVCAHFGVSQEEAVAAATFVQGAQAELSLWGFLRACSIAESPAEYPAGVEYFIEESECPCCVRYWIKWNGRFLTN